MLGYLHLNTNQTHLLGGIMKRCSVLFSLMILMLCSAAAPAWQDKQSMTAAEIIEKHLAAAGGRAALAKIKSRVAVGTVRKENETDARMAIMSEAPNRVSAIYAFQNYTWQLSYDGKQAIFRPTISKEASVIEKKYREILATGAIFNSISLYNLLTDTDENTKFEAKGTKKV